MQVSHVISLARASNRALAGLLTLVYSLNEGRQRRPGFQGYRPSQAFIENENINSTSDNHPVWRNSMKLPRAFNGVIPMGSCGNGRNELWVRDSWGNADFTGACKAHDQCYETCGSSKSACDGDFKSEMRAACKRAYSSPWHVVQKNTCLGIANGYHSAVHRLGGDSYRDAQRESNC